jgi:hypothetical protein
MRAVHRVRVAPASRSTALSAARALRPAFPTAIRFQPQSSSPLRFTSTQSTPLAATAAAAPPPSAAAATKPPAKRAPHVVTPSQSEVVDRFGDPPPMTGQVVRASKTHIALESPTGMASLCYDLNYIFSVHSELFTTMHNFAPTTCMLCVNWVVTHHA